MGCCKMTPKMVLLRGLPHWRPVQRNVTIFGHDLLNLLGVVLRFFFNMLLLSVATYATYQLYWFVYCVCVVSKFRDVFFEFFSRTWKTRGWIQTLKDDPTAMAHLQKIHEKRPNNHWVHDQLIWAKKQRTNKDRTGMFFCHKGISLTLSLLSGRQLFLGINHLGWDGLAAEKRKLEKEEEAWTWFASTTLERCWSSDWVLLTMEISTITCRYKAYSYGGDKYPLTNWNCTPNSLQLDFMNPTTGRVRS